jgi:hypothetical protein
MKFVPKMMKFKQVVFCVVLIDSFVVNYWGPDSYRDGSKDD